MAGQTDPYLSAYLRKQRIRDTVVVPDPGDQSKTLLPPPRRRPRVRKDLDAGPLEAEVQSFALHMAAEGKAPRTIRTYTEAVRSLDGRAGMWRDKMAAAWRWDLPGPGHQPQAPG